MPNESRLSDSSPGANTKSRALGAGYRPSPPGYRLATQGIVLIGFFRFPKLRAVDKGVIISDLPTLLTGQRFRTKAKDTGAASVQGNSSQVIRVLAWSFCRSTGDS